MLRFRQIKFKFFCFILCSVVVYIVLLINSFFGHNNRELKLDFKHVVVHLDLKGAPPKLEYLERLLPFFKGFGVSGVLMEYEDMFPYVGNLVNLSSRNHYERNELKNFLISAKKYEIEIIPLVQTFGHMEHALKLDEFKHLREVKKFPDSICPSNPESITLVKNMLEQVINFHNDVTPLQRIHIGCDEVFHINECATCVVRGLTSTDIFTNHVLTVSKLIHNFNSSIKVLIWDDMMRSTIQREWNIKPFDSVSEIEPVYWDYSVDSGSVSFINLHLYHRIFKTVWISTAFKGADGRQTNLPTYKNRLLNHYSWLTLIADYKYSTMKNVNFEGVLLTGWSRYSHMDPLCELLPPSIPSLLMNLLLIRKFQTGVDVYDMHKDFSIFFEKHILKDVSNELKCNPTFINFHNLDESINACVASRNELVHFLRQYQNFVKLMQGFPINDLNGNSSFEFYTKIKHFNVNHINDSMISFKKTLVDITTWKTKMQDAMAKYYDKFVIDEYVGYKIYPMVNKLKNALTLLEDYQKIHTWDRGPQSFPDLNSLE